MVKSFAALSYKRDSEIVDVSSARDPSENGNFLIDPEM